MDGEREMDFVPGLSSREARIKLRVNITGEYERYVMSVTVGLPRASRCEVCRMRQDSEWASLAATGGSDEECESTSSRVVVMGGRQLSFFEKGCKPREGIEEIKTAALMRGHPVPPPDDSNSNNLSTDRIDCFGHAPR